MFQEQKLRVCQECVAVFVVSLQWEHVEKKTKVTETHSPAATTNTPQTRDTPR